MPDLRHAAFSWPPMHKAILLPHRHHPYTLHLENGRPFIQGVRMLRLFTGAVLLSAFLSFPAHASGFTSPGWYQILDSYAGTFIAGGPYADRTSCQKASPSSSRDELYTCEYLAKDPDWDE